MHSLGLWAVVFACLVDSVFSYIPALPTNSTDDAIKGGLNVTDVSKVHLQWYMNGYVLALLSKKLC